MSSRASPCRWCPLFQPSTRSPSIVLGANSHVWLAPRSAELCARRSVSIGDFLALARWQRKIGVAQLAEGEDLYSNALSQKFARLRAGSLGKGFEPAFRLYRGHAAGTWVTFLGGPEMRSPLYQAM